MSLLHRNSEPKLSYSERLQQGEIVGPSGPLTWDTDKVRRAGDPAVGQVIEFPQPTPDTDPTPEGPIGPDHQLTA